MKKFTYVIAAALALTCAVSAVPTFTEKIPETSAIYIAPDPHSIPTSGLQASYFYGEIGEISYCPCGEIVTCIPIVNVGGGLNVTYKLNGEEFTPDNIVRNYINNGEACLDVAADTNATVTGKNEGYTGYESISFFPKEVNKDYTLEINVSFSSAVRNNSPNEVVDPIIVEENYKFNFKVDENGIIIPEAPSTYQQTEIFKREYGNYTAYQGDQTIYDNKVIVCTPWYWDGGYDVAYESNAELLSEEEYSSPSYYVNSETGIIKYIDGGAGNKVLTFDASKPGTYSVKVYNTRAFEENSVIEPIEFTYHVSENGEIGFPQTSKLTVPTDYYSAQQFIEQYGESETDGFQVIEVIPVVKSDNFRIMPSSETTEEKPYVTNTATYYYPDATSETCKGYQVTTYSMNRSLSSEEIFTDKLYHVTNTEYKVDEKYTMTKAYFCGYLIDKETKSFKEYLTEPASFAESQVFLKKYGNFCADPNQKKVIAVLPEHYEINHEIGGTAELLKTKNYADDMTEYVDDNGQIIQTVDLGGNKILMFDASKAGTYTIRIKETWAGNPDVPNNYNIDYTVADDGTITLSEPADNPQPKPEGKIDSFSSADKLFNGNGGYSINNEEKTLQIAVPINFSVEKPGGGFGYEEYDCTYTGNFNNSRLTDEEIYMNDTTHTAELNEPEGYYVYTYTLAPASMEVFKTDGTIEWVENAIKGDFSITFTISEDLNPYGDNDKYVYRFNADDSGTVTNTGFFSKRDSGDANGDGIIDIADVVAIASYVSNPENNSISNKARIFCDVHARGNGVDASDLLMIQQYLAKIITEL